MGGRVIAVTVATRREGYYDALIESCARNGLPLVVLGWGQEWQGFSWRFLIIRSYLGCLQDDDIVIVLDGYDMIATQDVNVIRERFSAIGAPILMSVEKTRAPRDIFFHHARKRIFGHCPKADVCGGAYMGYVYALRALYDHICNEFDSRDPAFSQLDDQRVLTHICNDSHLDGLVGYDKECRIFHTTFMPADVAEVPSFFLSGNRFLPEDDHYEVRGGRLYLKSTNESPCFIHGVGNTDMGFLIDLYNLPPRYGKRGNYLLKTWRHQLQFFWREGAATVVTIIIIILFYASYPYSRKK